jgi:hypothetical protein
MVRRSLVSLVMLVVLLAGGCEWFVPDVVVPSEAEFVGLEANLMAYYAFDASADDSSGWGNHGDPQGAVLAPDRFGVPNKAFTFDGDDDAVTVADHKSLEITGPITLCAWVCPVEQKSQDIIRKGSATNRQVGGSYATYYPYGLSLSATGDVIFSLSPAFKPTQVRKQGYPINQWFHVAGVFDGDEMRLYVDGVLVGSEAVVGTIPLENAPLLIGTRLRLPSSTFHGAIDEVRIYDRALNPGEIERLAD